MRSEYKMHPPSAGAGLKAAWVWASLPRVRSDGRILRLQTILVLNESVDPREMQKRGKVQPMKPAWEWTETYLNELIVMGVRESLTLDYKRCDALQRKDGKIREISKDVSAFANYAGGTIVYGIIEDKNVPTGFDDGLDPAGDINKEWLEQVITSNIQQRIDGVRIHVVDLPTSKPSRSALIVFVPQSKRAPHMANDYRYYKRYNFESVPMEDYEVRDVSRRQERS